MTADDISQKPAPSLGQASSDPKTDTTGRNDQSATEQSATEKQPAAAETVQTTNTKTEPSNDSKEHDEKATNERWLTIYTGLLALFTFLLFGECAIWFYGYVDYIDIFQGRHRAGYGRIHNQVAGELVFITSDAYNYDRTRIPGEGNDWDET